MRNTQHECRNCGALHGMCRTNEAHWRNICCSIDCFQEYTKKCELAAQKKVYKARKPKPIEPESEEM